MGKLWGHSFVALLCATQQSLHSMDNQRAVVPTSIDKVRWGAKATAYGACTIGSGMLLVTELYDFATNNTPETSISTRFAGIGAALVGLKCFGFGAYKAFRELIAGYSDKEALIQEIIARINTARTSSAHPPEALSSSSFAIQSISKIPSVNLLGNVPQQGSNQSLESFVAATKPNGIDILLQSSLYNPKDEQ